MLNLLNSYINKKQNKNSNSNGGLPGVEWMRVVQEYLSQNKKDGMLECYKNTSVVLTPELRQTDRVKEIETFLV